MKIHTINPNLIDIFLDFDTHTGYDPECWLRLRKSKPDNKWKQIAGIKLPSYRYQNLLKTLETK